jgi:hypothetical protein
MFANALMPDLPNTWRTVPTLLLLLYRQMNFTAPAGINQLQRKIRLHRDQRSQIVNIAAIPVVPRNYLNCCASLHEKLAGAKELPGPSLTATQTPAPLSPVHIKTKLAMSGEHWLLQIDSLAWAKQVAKRYLRRSRQPQTLIFEQRRQPYRR